MIHRIRQRISNSGGFTLVESIVAFAVLAIVMAVVAGLLSFGTRIAHEQEAAAKADMLSEMVRVSIEDDLRYASDVRINAAGSSVQFSIPASVGTNGGSNGNLPMGTYNITSSEDGKVHISQSVAKGDKAVEGPILPEKSFIDGATVTCTFSKQDRSTVAVETDVTIGTVTRTVSSSVRLLNGAVSA